jgi:ABC-type phosphate transport system substrate-binding protein
MTKTILAGASAIALLAIANGASATTLDSGGSTLAAKVYRDIFNCYAGAVSANVILATSASATDYANAYDGTPANISYPTALPTQCTSAYLTTTNGPAIDYLPVGSGAGQKAFTYYSPASWGLPAIGNPVAWLSDALGITTLAQASTEFDFSGSDSGLSQTQISSAATGHGAVVQFPSLFTPIDLAVNDSGSKADNVKLTTAQICGIYGGTITNWSQVASPGNRGVNTGAITPVVRADSSGTSYIFSNYLSIVCPAVSSAFSGFTAANGFPSTTPNWSAAAAANGGSSAGFVSQSGSGGVASYVANNANSINYVSPDYVGAAFGYKTLPASIQYPAATALFVKPSSTAAADLAAGVTTVPNNAYDWGQPLNNQVLAQNLPLNNSNAQFPKGAYPIGGYTFIETYACPAQPSAVNQLWTWYFTSSGKGLHTYNEGYKFVSAYLKATGFAAPPVNTKTGVNYPAAILSNQISQIGSGC